MVLKPTTGSNGDNDGFSWTNENGLPAFDVYSHATQVYYEGPQPPDSGDWYFHTVGLGTVGPNSPRVFQEVDLSAGATAEEIDNGTVLYEHSAWLSGWTASDDHGVSELQFFDEAGVAIGGALRFDGGEFGPDSFFTTTVTGDPLDTFGNPFAAWKAL